MVGARSRAAHPLVREHLRERGALCGLDDEHSRDEVARGGRPLRRQAAIRHGLAHLAS